MEINSLSAIAVVATLFVDYFNIHVKYITKYTLFAISGCENSADSATFNKKNV